MSEATRGVGGRRRAAAAAPASADAAAPPLPPPAVRAVARSLGTGDPERYAGLRLPLTAALIRAGLGGLSMSTPGHRGGRLFGAWEAPSDAKRR